MILLSYDDDGVIRQNVCGDMSTLLANKAHLEDLGYCCMLVEDQYLHANRIVNCKPVYVSPLPSESELLATLRAERNYYLLQTDWTQMPDAPLSDSKRQEWAIYRQQLRDIPADYSADNVVWPSPPN